MDIIEKRRFAMDFVGYCEICGEEIIAGYVHGYYWSETDKVYFCSEECVLDYAWETLRIKKRV